MNSPLPFRAYSGNESYAFVSYAHSDADKVYPDIQWIHDSICNIWYDEGIAPASTWRDEIASTILNARVFLAFLSPNFARSEECKKELWFAIDHQIPVIAIHLEAFDLPPGLNLSLSSKQAILRFQYEDEAYQAKLKESLALLSDSGAEQGENAVAQTATTEPGQSRHIANRYQITELFFEDSGWQYYRAIDHLKNKTVSIKKSAQGLQQDSKLAFEYERLSRLSHLNIVRALDFCAAGQGSHILSLDLQDNIQTLSQALDKQPLAVVVDYLSQALRAIDYLRQNKVRHNNINANTIWVADGQVKLLGFNDSEIAASAQLAGAEKDLPADIQQTGVTFLNALAQQDSHSNRTAVPDQAEAEELARSLGMDPKLTTYLYRLCARDDSQRFSNITAAFEELRSLKGIVNVETALTRENALQKAQFVGRQSELQQIELALSASKRNQGSIIFIAGESGVGKSRLLNEIEIRARLADFSVVEGHAVEGDTGTYKIWSEVTRFFELVYGGSNWHNLSRTTNFDESSFLKIENALKFYQKPLLIVLEDLHWAGSESLKLLRWLAKPLQGLPVVIVGSFRPEEEFDPGDAFDNAHTISLSRLADAEVEELASSILRTAPSEKLKEFLAHETEGNSLFIVETLRVLAEEAGTLSQIDSRQLPEKVLSGGMKRILSRRISNLSDEDLEALAIASVIGRDIDFKLLQLLTQGLDLPTWAARCTQQAVYEHVDGSYRFTHEKLREYVYDSLAPDKQKEIHQLIATTIETQSSNLEEAATTLAFHWKAAGKRDQEAKYAVMAGERTLNNGAISEAVVYFRRAGELMNSGVTLPREELDAEVLVKVRLGEAYYRLGNLTECYAHSVEATKLMGVYFPKSGFTMGAAAFLELLRLVIARKYKANKRAHAAELSQLQLRLTDIYFFSLNQPAAIWSALRAANESRAHNIRDELAKAYSILGSLASAVKLDKLARSYALDALRLSRRTYDVRNRSYVFSRLSMQCVTNCEWDFAHRRIELALRAAKRSGEFRLVLEMMSMHALVDAITGNFRKALGEFTALREYAERVGDRQTECWGAQGEAVCLLRLGHPEEAVVLAESTLDTVHDPYMKTEAISSHSIMALVLYRLGETAKARHHIDEALSRLVDTPPLAHWMQGVLNCLLESVFAIYEDTEQTSQVRKIKKNALRSLKTYAKYQTLGRPFSHMWQGIDHAQQGKLSLARKEIEKGLEWAQFLQMPYDTARLQLELSKLQHSDSDLEAAGDFLTNAGCYYELDELKQQLEVEQT